MAFHDEMQVMIAGYLAAYAKHDAARCAMIYARTASVITPWAALISGRDAIAKAHEDWFGADEENKRMDVLDCAASGDLGYMLIEYAADVAEPDGTVTRDSGTNLCAMVRRSGIWQIMHSSMNATFVD